MEMLKDERKCDKKNVRHTLAIKMFVAKRRVRTFA